MRIAVNTRLLLKNKLEGIGWFSYETLKRITVNHPEHQFYFIFDRPYAEEFIFNDNITPLVAYPQARHPYLWYMFFEYGIPYHLKKIKPDLFLSTDGWLPLRMKIPAINVIHDINFEHHPELIKPVALHYYKRYFHKFAKKATRLATVSEFSKNDIHHTYRIPLDKIDVVYNGCHDLYRPFSQQEIEAAQKEYADGFPYFLFVGLIHKRKNLDNIFKAFDSYKDGADNNIKLVVVGEKKWWNGDIQDAFEAMKHKGDVIFLGRLSVDELYKITASSVALLYPSFFEGFGIPILEAFNAETPVITSNITSMPEIAGDAALFVNPHSIEQITEAMKMIVNDQQLRSTIIAKGRIRRTHFSWDKTAERLWNTIEKGMLLATYSTKHAI